jgi:hypothetical protein
MLETGPLQADSFFGHAAEGAMLAELGPGDTMLIPGAWPHAVATLADSIVVGGNFLHALDLRCSANCVYFCFAVSASVCTQKVCTSGSMKSKVASPTFHLPQPSVWFT